MTRPRPNIRTACTAARPLLLLVALVLAASASYTVKPGDTLSRIAQRFGVAVGELQRANGITDPHRVVAGRRLEIPGSAGAAARHRVAAGETLSGIAARYGVSTGALAAANGIQRLDLVREGRTLSIPARGSGSGGGRAPARAAGRADVGALIDQTARRYGVDPALAKAVAWQESGWNQGVVSSAGAVGVMQVLPSTGRFVSDSLVGRRLDLSNTADNVEAGVAFLDYLQRKTGGDTRATLGGYYQGLRSVRLRGVYPDTVRYADNVLVLRRRFS
jgi:soluble lytic murein transglycosylase-like protein